MNKYFASLLASGCLLTACTLEAQSNYNVNAVIEPEFNNHMAYIVDWDDTTPLDSVIVSSGMARFQGHVDAPKMGRIMVGGKRGPIFVLEKGAVSIDAQGNSTGTPQNDLLTALGDSLSNLVERINALDGENPDHAALYPQLLEKYNNFATTAYEGNKGTPVGLYWFLQKAYEMNLDELDAAIKADPQLGESVRVKSVRNGLVAKQATMPGHKYLDFEVTYDGKKEHLSSYVQGDHYTLVDFWASWCGPCMRQTPFLKSLYEKYKDKGLEIVGVAVWDEPANTLRAIKSHGITWPCILNAQTIPTDLYGINGIPCIILIAPDGTIVSRDKMGNELVAEVDKVMEEYIQKKAAAAWAAEHPAKATEE